MFMQLRAHLSGMTLHGIDTLSDSEASTIGAQEPDPAEEEAKPVTEGNKPCLVSTDDRQPCTDHAAAPRVSKATRSQRTQGTCRQARSSSVSSPPQAISSDDEILFGSQWPLPDAFKLDKTYDRITIRKQINRLGELGYEFDPLSQEWHLLALAE